MIEASSGPIQARQPARLFSGWNWLAAALALVPVVRTWQLTRDLDTTVTTVAVFAGAAWQIVRLLSQVPNRPLASTRAVALLGLAGGIWQLSWVSPDDFWFFRVSLVLWAVCWLVLPWGWAGLIFGWRVLAAFGLWSGFCDAPWQWSRDAYQAGDWIGPALAVITAQIAGAILWMAGAPVRVTHNLIRLGNHLVSVGVPCTALPLAKLLLLLLLLATLLLRLQWLQAVRLALLTVLVSFLISIGRVMILAYVVRDPALFHYWHDADGGGGGWFTALGMLAIAFLIARQMFGQSARTPEAPVPALTIAVPPSAALIAVGGMVALTIARLTPLPMEGDFVAPPPPPNLEVAQDVTTRNSPVSTQAEPDAPLWIRKIAYVARNGPSRIDIIAALIPRTFSGDPADHPSLTREFALSAKGQPDRKQSVQFFPTPTGGIWLTLVVESGPTIATPQAWTLHLRHEARQPRRWVAWLAHRAPLRDKHSYWLAAIETAAGASAAPPPPKLFRDWIAVLQHSP